MKVSQEKFIPFWERYKALFDTPEFDKHEKYKWPVLAQCYSKWDWYGPDRATMFKNTFDIQGPKNLWMSGQFYPVKMIQQYFEIDPKLVEDNFTNLFNESVSLETRISSFISFNNDILPKLQEQKPEAKIATHYHGDLRAISLYLSLQYPDKYFLYKHTIFKTFSDQMGLTPVRTGQVSNYSNYLEICQEIKNYIQQDESFLQEYKLFCSRNGHYSDPNLHLLVQDFIYTVASYFSNDNASSHWLFVTHRDVSEFKNDLEGELLNEWQIFSNTNKVKAGDKVIIWITGNEAGCYGLADVLESPIETFENDGSESTIQNQNENQNLGISITHHLQDKPILLSEFEHHKSFANLIRSLNDSNNQTTKETYDEILKWIESANPSKFEQVLSLFSRKDIDYYFGILSKIIEKLQLKGGENNIVFNVRNDGFAFIVGNRYSWRLLLAKKKTIFAGISIEKFATNVWQFNGPSFLPYYNHSNIPFDKIIIDNIYAAIQKQYDSYKGSPYSKYNIEAFERFAFNYSTSDNSIHSIENKMQNCNTILFGPPGTGKTFNTINKAINIIHPDFDLTQPRSEIKKEYERLVEGGQIVFTTFHQSMSYEDFIEGIKPLKPQINDASVKYDIQPGIFYSICETATSNFQNAKNENKNKISFEAALEMLKEEWEENQGMEFQLKTNGFAFTILGFSNTSIQFKKASGGTGHNLNFSSLKDVYYGRKVDFTQGVWRYYNSVLQKLLSFNNAQSNGLEIKKYVVIIDEINRGNVSQIFGELITLIEEDKRIGKEEALEVMLPYSKEQFGVPPNLYIIGTLNTADRSVEALDAALRRRFSFEEMPPVYDLVGLNYDFAGIKASDLLKTINKRIEKLLDKDHQIGHSYLQKKVGEDAEQKLLAAFYKNIIPLLQEYFFGDYSKIGLVLGKGFIRRKEWDNTNDSFADFDTENTRDYDERDVYEIIHYTQERPEIVVEIGRNSIDMNFQKAIRLLMKQEIE